MKHAEQQIVVEGSPEECFEALVEWQRAVKSVEVITRHKAGLGKDVTFEIDAKVKTINYTLRYSYEAPHRISWDYVEGDVKDVDGEMVFEDLGDGTTLATYSLAIDPGVWMPGRLQKILNEQVMKGSVEDLKKRVEEG
jgi:coenzyme Q-binding protein COQ10